MQQKNRECTVNAIVASGVAVCDVHISNKGDGNISGRNYCHSQQQTNAKNKGTKREMNANNIKRSVVV